MGYMIKSQEMPIFITYDKHEDISDSTKYEDEFLSQDELKWFTKSNRTLKTKEVQKILSHRAKGIKMYIFVQKKMMMVYILLFRNCWIYRRFREAR